MQWYKHYLGDYARDTSDLSVTEHGAYRLLLDAYYSRGSPLPCDKSLLYRICRAHRLHEKRAVDVVVERFFTNSNMTIKHKRVDQEILKYQAQCLANRRPIRERIVNESGLQPDTRTRNQSTTRSKTLSANADGAWEKFWGNYPRKTAKQAALKAWGRLKDSDLPAVFEGLEACKESDQWRRGIIPHPATFLNGRRWEDDLSNVAVIDLGPCAWNSGGSRDPNRGPCGRPGVEERDRIVYCEAHKHLHLERVR
jgi:uncharacterized protein YdaU (DUF1376 family)